MRKLEKLLSSVLGRLLFIGFSGQILLGLLWMCANMGSLPLFGDTVHYVQVSGTLVCDEYTGPLYPAVLLLIRFLFRGNHLRWYTVMYLLQLGLAFVSVYCLVNGLEELLHRDQWKKNKKTRIAWCVWGSLVVLTFPMQMQLHLAILPGSFSSSFVFFYFAVFLSFLGIVSNGDCLANRLWYQVGGLGLCWLLLSLNAPHFVWIGALLPAAAFLIILVKSYKTKRNLWFRSILVFVAFVGIYAGLRGSCLEKGAYGRPAQSLSTTLFNRIAWTTLLDREYRWPELLTDVLEPDVMAVAGHYPDAVFTVLEPALEQQVGVAAAQEMYGTLAHGAWLCFRSEILHDVVVDATGYAAAPVIVDFLFDGSTFESYTIRNFDVMKRQSPVLTGIYMDYGILWFEIALVPVGIAVLIAAGKALAGVMKKSSPGRRTKGLLPFLATAFIFITVYCVRMTMQGAGIFDYKEAFVTTGAFLCLFVLFTVGTLFANHQEGEPSGTC